MTVTVVGLGKIGLPLAVQFARKGETVLGADINQETVDLVNEGIEPFPEEEN
jgi:UDP-N-acetyl-D-mannosaminuronate dehydrogenase